MSPKALVIAIPEAGPRSIDKFVYPSLEDFAEYADQVAIGLRKLGYTVDIAVPDTWNLTSKMLAEAVTTLLSSSDGDDVCVIHILSHAELCGVNPSVAPVGSDGETDTATRVIRWLEDLEDRGKAGPLTLIVLDTCFSGNAARTNWSGNISAQDLRGWVLAASAPGMPAYEARLSLALAKQLNALADNTLGISPNEEFVRWETFREKVRDEFARNITGIDSSQISVGKNQRMTGTALDEYAPTTLPFFPNPYYTPPGVVESVKNEADSGLGPFLDPITESPFSNDFIDGLDPEHFARQIHGQGGPRVGTAFTGRHSQLLKLSAWIDDSDKQDSVRVVTGSPGVGKSALLGVLVCAAHPFLRTRTESVWQLAATTARVPKLHPAMAAIHARAMSVPQILSSIGRQLELSGPEGEWTAKAMMTAFETLNIQPLIVLDAIDESDNVSGTIELLTHFATAPKPNGAHACRLLVGTRTGALWPIAQDWIGHLPDEQKTDLDNVPERILRSDLKKYLTSALSRSPHPEQLAEQIARSLTRKRVETRNWGEFLVASLFAVHVDRLITIAKEGGTKMIPISVPQTLPKVLDLDLSVGDYSSLRRGILTCLSWSKGAGMPLRLLRLLVLKAFSPGTVPSEENFNAAFARVRFYLRTSTDRNGELLWRLFHQGLTDHLHTGFPETGKVILEAFLADRPTDALGNRQWATAEPYLTRHALDHAIEAGQPLKVLNDTEYIVNADPSHLITALNTLATSRGNNHGDADQQSEAISAIYRQSLHVHSQLTPHSRRQVLQIDKARLGNPNVLASLSDNADLDSGLWNTAWGTGGAVNNQLLEALPLWPTRTVACTTLSGGDSVVVIGGQDGQIGVWDLTSHRLLKVSNGKRSAEIAALACTKLQDGKVVAITGSRDSKVRLWDLASRQPQALVLGGHRGEVTAVACTNIPDIGPVAITGGRDGLIKVWDLANRKLIKTSERAHSGPISALACAILPKVGAVAISSSGGGKSLRVWPLAERKLWGTTLRGQSGDVLAMACSTLPNVGPVVASGSRDGLVRIWDLAKGRLLGQPIPGHSGAIYSIGCTTLPGVGPVAITGSGDKTVRIWDLDNRSIVGTPFRGHSTAVLSVGIITLPDGRPVAVTGSGDALMRVWGLAVTGSSSLSKRGHTGPVLAMACTKMPNGRPVAITGGGDKKAYIWDLADSGSPRKPLRGKVEVVLAAACTSMPNTGPVAVTGSRDGRVRVWSLATQNLLDELHGPRGQRNEPILAIACSRLNDSKFGGVKTVAVTASKDGRAFVWNLTKTSVPVATLRGDAGLVSAVTCTKLASIDSVAVTGSRDGRIGVWDLSNHRLVKVSNGKRSAEIAALACTTLQDGKVVAITGSKDNKVRLWDLTGRQPQAIVLGGHEGQVTAVACTHIPNIGTVAITGGSDGLIRVWNLEKSLEIGEARFQLPDTPRTLVIEEGLLSVGMNLDIIVLSLADRNN